MAGGQEALLQAGIKVAARQQSRQGSTPGGRWEERLQPEGVEVAAMEVQGVQGASSLLPSPVALWEFFGAPGPTILVTGVFLQVTCWLLGFHRLTLHNGQHILHVSWCI